LGFGEKSHREWSVSQSRKIGQQFTPLYLPVLLDAVYSHDRLLDFSDGSAEEKELAILL
jgi:hypothetical protein